jgi:hypothetical protein
MTLPLTPDLLRASYNFLRATPPFKSWGLPPGEGVKFRVTRSRKTQGDHLLLNGAHTIRVSCVKVGYTASLLALMAHEMVHVVCDREGVRSEHGASFKKRAATVCRYHGFDPAEF